MKDWNTVYNCFEPDEDGLPTILHRIPDTSVMNFLRGVKLLQEGNRHNAVSATIAYANSYAENIVSKEIKVFTRPLDITREVSGLGSANADMRHISLKLLRQLVGLMKSDKPGAKRMLSPLEVDPDLIQYVDALETITASEMRKELRMRFHERFALEAYCRGAGIWEYRSKNRNAAIEIDFGGALGQQLRYKILHPPTNGMRLELMWGVGIGSWDYIHRGNWADALDVLSDIFAFFDRLFEPLQT
jgi:hypothetical protein